MFNTAVKLSTEGSRILFSIIQFVARWSELAAADFPPSTLPTTNVFDELAFPILCVLSVMMVALFSLHPHLWYPLYVVITSQQVYVVGMCWDSTPLAVMQSRRK